MLHCATKGSEYKAPLLFLEVIEQQRHLRSNTDKVGNNKVQIDLRHIMNNSGGRIRLQYMCCKSGCLVVDKECYEQRISAPWTDPKSKQQFVH